MRQWPVKLVVEILAPDARAPFPRPRRVAALDHKVGNVAVERDAPVVARLRQPDKVPYGFRRRLRLQLNREVAQVRLDARVALGLDAPRPEHKLLVRQQRAFAARLGRQARAGEAGGGPAGRVRRCVGRKLLVLDHGLAGDGRDTSSTLLRCLFQRARALVDVAAGVSRPARLVHGRLGLEHLVAHAAQRAGIDVARLALLLLLARQLRLLAVLQVLELVEVAARHVLRILQRDDVGPRKRLVVHQVRPHLGLDVHALHRVPRKDVGVAAVPDRHNVRVVGKHLVRDGVDQVALAVAQAGAQRVGVGIARKVESDQVLFL